MTSTTNPDFSEHLNNFYNNNPFVQLLGIQLKKIQFGQVTLSMKAQNQLSNFYHITHGGALASLADTTRSEERRVGKECRSRWSPYH